MTTNCIDRVNQPARSIQIFINKFVTKQFIVENSEDLVLYLGKVIKFDQQINKFQVYITTLYDYVQKLSHTGQILGRHFTRLHVRSNKSND